MTTSSVLLERDYFEDVRDLGVASAGLKLTLDAPRRTLWVEVAGGKIYVKVEGVPPDWFGYVVRALKRFAGLGPNWDTTGGKPVSPYAAAAAIRLLASILSDSTPLPDLIPMPSGNISVEWHMAGIDLEIEVGPVGAVCLHYASEHTGEDWEQPTTNNVPLLSGLLGPLHH